MKKFRWVAIVVGMILVAAIVFCTKGIRLERDEGSSQGGEQVAVQTELPAETETTPTEVSQDETVDDLAEQVPEDPNLTIRVDALDRKAENILTVKMEIVQIPPAVASDMAGAVKKFF